MEEFKSNEKKWDILTTGSWVNHEVDDLANSENFKTMKRQ